MRNVSSLFLLVFLLLSAVAAFAQHKEGANWLFGEKFHVDFNFPKPIANTFSFAAADSFYRGVASVSDKNGNLLFFSTGGVVGSREKVNGVYQAMPNGVYFKGGDSTLTMNELIVKSPADSNTYYLFFIGAQAINNTPYISLYKLQIDMRLNNGFGDVVPNSLQLLRKKVFPEILTAMLHQNNRDTWVMAASPTSDSLLTFLVTPNGLMPPVATKIPNQVFPNSGIKSSPNSELIAVHGIVAPPVMGKDALQVFDFNRTSGVPALRYSLPSPFSDNPFGSYAFSPDNSKLYAGTINYMGVPNRTSVYQYDLNAGNAAQVQQSRNVIYNTSAYPVVSDMQLAIDGKIYLIIENTALGQINCPNLYGAACRFKPDGINLNGQSTGISLPTLNQTLYRNANKLQAQAFKNPICSGDTVRLSAYGAGATQFKWDAANGLTAPSDTLANPLVSPTVTTTYRVTGSSFCNSDVAYVTVTVFPALPQVTVTGPLQAASLTNQEYAVQNPASGSTFNWEVTGGKIISGQGTFRILVNWDTVGEGTISVTETPKTGCKPEKISVTVQVTEGPEPIFYNVFTPDKNGRNDAFIIDNLKWYPENELRLYNRWGVEVYRKTNYQNNWKAEKASAGVYYYLFKAKGKSWKGWVEVVK